MDVLTQALRAYKSAYLVVAGACLTVITRIAGRAIAQALAHVGGWLAGCPGGTVAQRLQVVPVICARIQLARLVGLHPLHENIRRTAWLRHWVGGPV